MVGVIITHTNAGPNRVLPRPSVKSALQVLGLDALPETRAELHTAVKALLFRAHPDRNFSAPASTEFTQEILKARLLLLAQYD